MRRDLSRLRIGLRHEGMFDCSCRPTVLHRVPAAGRRSSHSCRTNLRAIVIRDGGSSADITEIEIDDGYEEHLSRHEVSIAEVQQLLAGDPKIRRNREDRAGTHGRLRWAPPVLSMYAPLPPEWKPSRTRRVNSWRFSTATLPDLLLSAGTSSNPQIEFPEAS